jgi:putative holliday junction resolvase
MRIVGRILALDYGLVRTGIAISDETKKIARAYKVVIGLEGLKKEINNIFEFYNIDKILLGISNKTNEEIGEIGVLSLKFSEYLKDKFKVEIDFIDEAMTTKEVERIFREMGRNIKKYKGEIDKYSAELMLQEYLDRL